MCIHKCRGESVIAEPSNPASYLSGGADQAGKDKEYEQHTTITEMDLPPPGILKANCDDSFFPETKRGGWDLFSEMTKEKLSRRV
jgi:hypothetical protein